MSSSEVLPPNPVTLASDEAMSSFYRSTGFEPDATEHAMLARLDATAKDLALTDASYWVETSRGLSIPASFEADEEVTIINFFRLAFEGTFVCYSKVVIGRIIGVDNGSVEALCLTFNEATLLPYLEPIPEQDLLHVPVLAVDGIEPTVAAA